MRNTHESGYTIIEALVAIAILLISIAGPMTIAMQGIKQGSHARDQVTAFYLGQEAIELVRATRDNNALSNTTWSDSLSACGAACGIDAANRTFFSCAAAENCNIYYDADGLNTGSSQRGVFTHDLSGNAATVYNRTITITAVGPGEYVVDAKVSWQSRISLTNELTVRSRVFDVYDNI